MSQRKNLKIAPNKNKEKFIRYLAKVEAAFLFLIEDRKTILEQYRTLKRIAKEKGDKPAINYVNPKEARM